MLCYPVDRHECALHFTICGTDLSSHSVDASSVCQKPNDGASVESLISQSTRSIAYQQPRIKSWDDTDDDVDVGSLQSKSTKPIVKQQKQPSKPISFSSYIERHAAAAAKLQDNHASRMTSDSSPSSEADTEVSYVRSIAARDSKRDEPLKKSTLFGKSTKTVPCRHFFKSGYCTFKEKCTYHHNEGEQTELYRKLWKSVDIAMRKGERATSKWNDWL